MQQFCCGDVVPGCAATFNAQTEEDLLTQVPARARKDHGLSKIPAALFAGVRSNFRDADAAA